MDGSASDCARADCMAHRAGTATARRTEGAPPCRWSSRTRDLDGRGRCPASSSGILTCSLPAA